MQDDRNRRSAVHPRAVDLNIAGNRRLARANESIRHAEPSLDVLQQTVPERFATPDRRSISAHPKFPDFVSAWLTLNGKSEGSWAEQT